MSDLVREALRLYMGRAGVAAVCPLRAAPGPSSCRAGSKEQEVPPMPNRPDPSHPRPCMPGCRVTARMWTSPSLPNCGRCGTTLPSMATSSPANTWMRPRAGASPTRPQFRSDAGCRRPVVPQAPFEVILVWKFSRFTRKREHAVAFKALLRRKGRQGGFDHGTRRRLTHRAS